MDSHLQCLEACSHVQASASSPGYSILSEADEQCINSTLAQLLMVMESLDAQIGACQAQHQSMCHSSAMSASTLPLKNAGL